MAEQSNLSKLVKQIKKSNNVLIALNSDPTIDELATALGLTLMLNKNKRRAVSVFSGEIPNVLKFLKPEDTFDKNVDGLRDFIITLDPDKADRIVCKVDDGVVKVFITPNNTTISKDDLGFEQGDYNVDLVIALGVDEKEHLDKALAAHGRILSNAFVAAIGVDSASTDLGNLNILEPNMSSYAELVATLPALLDKDATDKKHEPALDEPVATALLTALVAATNRFSNNKTTAEIMNLAADLMKVGADQQQIANELSKEMAKQDSAEVKKAESSSTDEIDIKKDKKATQEIDLSASKKEAEVKSQADVKPSPKVEAPAKVDPKPPVTDAPNVSTPVNDGATKVKADFSNIDEYEASKKAQAQNDLVENVLEKANSIKNINPQPTVEDQESQRLEQQLKAVAQTNATPVIDTNGQLSPIPASTPMVDSAVNTNSPSTSAPAPAPNSIDPLMPPPLPDFSNLPAGMPPLPPTPPSFGAPMTDFNTAPAPTDVSNPVASVGQTVPALEATPVPARPTVNPVETPASPATQPAPTPVAADPVPTTMPGQNDPFAQLDNPSPAIQNHNNAPYQPNPVAATNPVMQDQVYPPAPADKSQFVIPE